MSCIFVWVVRLRDVAHTKESPTFRATHNISIKVGIELAFSKHYWTKLDTHNPHNGLKYSMHIMSSRIETGQQKRSPRKCLAAAAAMAV